MSYRILCSISGGFTGNRSAYMKVNGKERRFTTLQQAEACACRLRKSSADKHARATFRYAVEAL